MCWNVYTKTNYHSICRPIRRLEIKIRKISSLGLIFIKSFLIYMVEFLRPKLELQSVLINRIIHQPYRFKKVFSYKSYTSRP